MSVTNEQIYSIVNRIPEGRVTSYGQIARLVGNPRGARQVGYALSALPDDQIVPWHRVVNAEGQISQRAKAGYEDFQRYLLEDEGIIFNQNGSISMSQFQWQKDVLEAPSYMT